MKYQLVLTAAVATTTLLGGSIPATALNIALISNRATPDIFADDIDEPLVAALQNLGHTVDRTGMNGLWRDTDVTLTVPTTMPAGQGAAAAKSYMENPTNSIDLAIFSRGTNSGHYDADPAIWNDINVPMIMMSALFTRSNRWGWLDSTSANSITPDSASADMVIDRGYPLLNGGSFGQTADVWPDEFANGNPTSGEIIDITIGQLPNGATRFGRLNTASAANNATLVDIPAGVTAFSSNSTDRGTLAARRVFFAIHEYIDGPDGFDDGSPNDTGDREPFSLQPEGIDMLGTLIDNILSPFPVLTDGDTNYDGVLDVENDFQAIVDNFLDPVYGRGNGDVDGSGFVDFDDFRLWKDNFISSGGSLAGVDLGPFAAYAVPEPNANLLMLASATFFGWIARRRR